MSDQAQGLRALADQARRDQNSLTLPDTRLEAAFGTPLSALMAEEGLAVADGRLLTDVEIAEEPRRGARLIAVTSGKGGVGKTNFSSNLALVLAQAGARVIVLDADLGLANLHVVMGLTPSASLEHVMRGEKSLREILYPGPAGIQIVAGASGIMELANLDANQRERFVAGLGELDSLADIILLDTGAGLSHAVLAFLNAVEEIIVVTTPEPTAITDAYATIKVLSQQNPDARIMLVVNMAQNEAEAEGVASRVSSITRQFLKMQPEYLGCIPSDPSVGRAVRMQQPFALSFPNCAATRSVLQIALRLGYRTQSAGVNGFVDRIQRFFGLAAATK